MQTITIKETRNNLAEIIEKVAVGNKTFIITKFGKAKAQLVPVSKSVTPTKKRRDFPGFGMWANRRDMQDSAKWATKIRSEWKNRYEPTP